MSNVKTDYGSSIALYRANSITLSDNQGASLGVDINGNLLVNSSVSAGANVSLSAPPAALTAGVDTSFTFASKINHFFLQNNTTTNINFDLDTGATLGSPLLLPGQYISMDIPVTVIHILSAAASNVNGSTGANIVLKGWL